MNQSLISVLIPVYNVEKYVEIALRSIINQTYENLEIIVIDDASTDNTYSIVKELQKSDSRIKLYKNNINSQIAITLNKAFFYSTGEYILRMDGDDISMPDRAKTMLEFLINNPQFDLVGSSMMSIDPDGNIIGQTIHYQDENLLRQNLRYVIPMSHIWMAKRTVYEKLHGYRNIPGAEDDDFVFRATSNGFRYTNLENYFGYHVRLGRSGNSNNLLGLKKLKLRDYTYKLYLEQIKNDGKDSFTYENMENFIKTNQLLERLHIISSDFLYKAIKSKSERNYLKFIIYTVYSLISPYQAKYLYERIIYKIKSKFWRKYDN